MLIDDVVITIKAGDGGKGSVHFKRNAQTARGGPDGGDGGYGGDIYIKGTDDLSVLSAFQYKKSLRAEDGIAGGRQNMNGRRGQELVIEVPIGTRVNVEDSVESYEIENKTTRVLIARGGKGGRGNTAFKSATNQAPHTAEPGEKGEEKRLHITLRLIADIGLIGLPNAGKSSLLASLTNATPKIGNYKFTTLEPNLGIMPLSQDGESDAAEKKRLILADIPGLIEGAHVGKGLGIKFLKHIEKTKILIHCIDSTTEDVKKAYETVRSELDSYSELLSKKQEIILLTKIDLTDEQTLTIEKKKLRKIHKDVMTVSIYSEADLRKFSEKIATLSL